jgi:hypothetical protein
MESFNPTRLSLARRRRGMSKADLHKATKISLRTLTNYEDKNSEIRPRYQHGRFDAAHELGHLTMHTHTVPRSREAELEADRFAAAFLMPQGDVFGHVPPSSMITRKAIIRLKRRWGVSAMALVNRLYKLRIIKDWQYRTLVIGLSSDGYRSSEPEGLVERDTSQIFAKVFSTLRAEGVTRSAIARDLAFTTTEIDSLLVGLIMAGVPNVESNVTSIMQPPSVTRPPSRFKLKVVKSN